MVTLFFAENPPGSNWDPESSVKAHRSSTGKKKHPWVTPVAAGGSLLFLLVFITLALLNLLSPGDDTTESGTTSSTAIAEATNAETLASLGRESPTPNAPVASPPSNEALEPIIEVVTVVLTNTPPPPTPTNTAVPIAPTTANTPVPSATILHPDGRLVQFIYDDYSFYILNLDDEQIEIAPIAFEGLNADGESAGYQFSGSIWATFYETLDSGRCNRIETRQAPFYLRPGQCGFYNATVTPILTDDTVFWSSQNGIITFRVLWDDNEIGRCPVDGRICEVFLPRE
jgi:hypothetical protein